MFEQRVKIKQCMFNQTFTFLRNEVRHVLPANSETILTQVPQMPRDAPCLRSTEARDILSPRRDFAEPLEHRVYPQDFVDEVQAMINSGAPAHCEALSDMLCQKFVSPPLVSLKRPRETEYFCSVSGLSSPRTPGPC